MSLRVQVFCDFLIAIACRVWPGIPEFAALTKLLGKKGLPSFFLCVSMGSHLYRFWMHCHISIP